MLTFFSLAFLAMLLPLRPAAAQGQGQQSASWDIVYSQNGTDAFTHGYSGSPYAWGSLNDAYLMGGSAVFANAGSSTSITGSGTITATLTWNPHGTGQPAPRRFGCTSPHPPASAAVPTPARPMTGSRTRS